MPFQGAIRKAGTRPAYRHQTSLSTIDHAPWGDGMKIRTILRAALIGSMLSGAPAFAEDLNIAVVGPMTGPIANIGDQFKQGAKAAAAAINAKGGVNGRQINLSIEDDVC